MPSLILKQPQLEELAKRNHHAASLLQPLLPDEIECSALYLRSQTKDWDLEKHQLLLITRSTLELYECEVTNADWASRGGQLILRRDGLKKSVCCIRLDAIREVSVKQESDQWGGAGSEPTIEEVAQIHLARPLGSLGTSIPLPFGKQDAYEEGAETTPLLDAASVMDSAMAYLRNGR